MREHAKAFENGAAFRITVGIKHCIGIAVPSQEALQAYQFRATRMANEDRPDMETEPPQVVQGWAEFPDPKNAVIAFDWQFPKGRCTIGDVLTYHVRATDNRPGEPNVSESSKFKVEIKDLQAERQAKQKAYFEWRSHVEKALDMQKNARKQTNTLLRSLGVSGDERKKPK